MPDLATPSLTSLPVRCYTQDGKGQVEVEVLMKRKAIKLTAALVKPVKLMLMLGDEGMV